MLWPDPRQSRHVTSTHPGRAPDILFGAFDRHNFGDMLLPHVLARQLPGRPLRYAGLAERDLSSLGGHRVSALARLVSQPELRAASLIHVGGEILCCEAWEAAVMLLPAGAAGIAAAHFGLRPHERQAWARAQLGTDALAPYTAAPALFPATMPIVYHAVGGVDLDRRDAGLRAEVLGKLRAAAHVSVRDVRTRQILATNGIAARLVPDPAVMVATLFAARIRHRARHGEAARLLAALARGYVAVQFSADFGDDATLDTIAAQLEQARRSSGCDVVLFRAGAAPWHDEMRVYERLAQRMAVPPLLFRSLNIWDICALIAHARGFAGSSLHGRIVAMAFALPRLNLAHPDQVPETSKQAAFAATWDAGGAPGVVAVSDLAAALDSALALARAPMEQAARDLVAAARHGLFLP